MLVIKIIVLIYLSAVLIFGTYDLYTLIKKGKVLMAKKEALEGLAGIHGYSSSGWNRYEEYLNFTTEYQDAIEVYQKFLHRPIYSALMVYLNSFVTIILSLYRSLEIKISIERKNKEKKK